MSWRWIVGVFVCICVLRVVLIDSVVRSGSFWMWIGMVWGSRGRGLGSWFVVIICFDWCVNGRYAASWSVGEKWSAGVLVWFLC